MENKRAALFRRIVAQVRKMRKRTKLAHCLPAAAQPAAATIGKTIDNRCLPAPSPRLDFAFAFAAFAFCASDRAQVAASTRETLILCSAIVAKAFAKAFNGRC